MKDTNVLADENCIITLYLVQQFGSFPLPKRQGHTLAGLLVV